MEKENLEDRCEFERECKNCKVEGDYNLCSKYRTKKNKSVEFQQDRQGFIYGAGI